jgi:tetratricopeptide (TPR) repeat protein
MKQQVLPEGWYTEFLGKADMEESFRRLEGIAHFHAETMRGRIRSLQLRVEDAWLHFERALSLAADAPMDIPNLVRQFLLNLYLFDNALLEGPVNHINDLPEAKTPDLPEHVLDEYPEVAYVFELRRCAEGYLRLHLGESASARKIFKELIADFPGVPNATISSYYCGLAAAEHNLGLQEEALRTLENAALCIQTGGVTMNRARGACILFAFYSWLAKEDEARAWRSYLEGIDCPESTKHVFEKRAQLLIERCTRAQSLVLL